MSLYYVSYCEMVHYFGMAALRRCADIKNGYGWKLDNVLKCFLLATGIWVCVCSGDYCDGFSYDIFGGSVRQPDGGLSRIQPQAFNYHPPNPLPERLLNSSAAEKGPGSGDDASASGSKRGQSSVYNVDSNDDPSGNANNAAGGDTRNESHNDGSLSGLALQMGEYQRRGAGAVGSGNLTQHKGSGRGVTGNVTSSQNPDTGGMSAGMIAAIAAVSLIVVAALCVAGWHIIHSADHKDKLGSQLDKGAEESE
ncbi:uncharacterized protein LOC129586928 isoform X3 [Paramacrobiotus metropolitanus]|uniref:uncharacterized protein LOC129586928 isoform X3 n=1 Tax=Paramacrobiotus metropolitanus TaxID=2943436 RepID=UPI0024465CA5|nr:uncharacterized protein LOC129586928 isoform X3 [Paramacrobiotus metropolitanus]